MCILTSFYMFTKNEKLALVYTTTHKKYEPPNTSQNANKTFNMGDSTLKFSYTMVILVVAAVELH